MVTALGNTKCDHMIDPECIFHSGSFANSETSNTDTHTVKCRGYENIDFGIILSDVSGHLPIFTCMVKMKEIVAMHQLFLPTDLLIQHNSTANTSTAFNIMSKCSPWCRGERLL